MTTASTHPGLAALERELEKLGEVYVVAPATEQSGVGHSITYLSPLIVKELFDGQQRRGWAVEGSAGRLRQAGSLRILARGGPTWWSAASITD